MKYTWRKGNDFEADMVYEAEGSSYSGGINFPDLDEGYEDYTAGIEIDNEVHIYEHLDSVAQAMEWVEAKLREVIEKEKKDRLEAVLALFKENLAEIDELSKYLPDEG